MQLRKILRNLGELEHWSHQVALGLVLLAALAGAVSSLIPPSANWAGHLTTALHWFHWIAIALVAGYGALYFFFSRKPGQELAKILEKNTPNKNDPKMTQNKENTGPLRPVPLEDVEFVAKTQVNLVSILNEMNYSGYVGSNFELTPKEIATRNAEFLDRNAQVFMLMRDTNRATTTLVAQSTMSDFIGYTCVLPLNEIGTDVYLRGLIPDRKFPASLISKNNDAATALLLFAIYLREEYRTKHVGRKYSPFLERCITHHIDTFGRLDANKDRDLVLWVQTESDEMREQYVSRGYEKTKNVSYESFPLMRKPLSRQG
jgi:hypothetical protein